MDWDALVWESGLAEGSGLCCHYPSEKLDPGLPYIAPVPVGI